ncbi:glycosyltransferase BC10-like [Argentina anserina]|uniref:glycosyltransferase BC10-like n=1 Tax=Argentina anserina TaxID=57926 RepID=UPI00217674AE|nr:glycosyltransferase BC10-like [Potentilla anserina]
MEAEVIRGKKDLGHNWFLYWEYSILTPTSSPPKVAFLFLVRRNLPLDFLWGIFFKNGDAAIFSIYIHSEPGFVFDEFATRSAFFFGRQLDNSIKIDDLFTLQVVWGESSMIESERLLFKEALYERANQRFSLLSVSCVPLYNFSYIYNYVLSSPKSFVDSFIDVKGCRYDPKMSPTIRKKRWRKGSEWITLVRKHAEIVVDDNTVFPLFRQFCKRWPPTPSSFRRQLRSINWTLKLPLFRFKKHRNCIPDEHYVQTLLAISGTDNQPERRAVTYTLWNQSNSNITGKTRSWHPLTFDYADAAPQKLKEIKEINHVYNEYEQHNEFCHTNSKVTPCFLFARKFTARAAVRLLRESLVGSYDETAIPS